jgi:glyoxylase-like metal-dependent hydrolase (beta-lactamase superfamily II)
MTRTLDGPPAATVPAAGGWTVGSVRVTALYDGTLFTRPERIYSLAAHHFPVLPASLGLDAADWDAHERTLSRGLLELTLGGFLVDTGDGRLVLVDTGQGPTDRAPEPELTPQVYGRLLDSLRRAGAEPEDVTDVVLTHLHADHVGWASRDGRPSFPNATYRCHAEDLATFVPADEVATRALSPALDHLVAWDGAETIAGPIAVRPAPGHTAGTTIVTIESEGEQLWLLGDVYHSVPELTDAIRWCGMADADAVGALRTRLVVADQLEHQGIAFAAGHFPGLPLQRLVRVDGLRVLTDCPGGRSPDGESPAAG